MDESGFVALSSGLRLFYHSCEGYLHVCLNIDSCVHMVGVCVSKALFRVCLYIHLLIFKAGSLPGLGVTK